MNAIICQHIDVYENILFSMESENSVRDIKTSTLNEFLKKFSGLIIMSR